MATALEQLALMQQQMQELQTQIALLQKQALLESATQMPNIRPADTDNRPDAPHIQNTSNEAHQLLLKQLSNLDDHEAKVAIRQHAEREVGQYGAQAIAAVEASLVAEVEQYKTIPAFDNVAGVFAQNSINTTATFNRDGYVAQSTQIQQQVPFPEKAGAIWANASLAQDENLNLTGGSAGVNYVGVPFRVGDLDAVAVGNATVNLPVDGKLTGENVSLLAGGIVKAHEKDSANYTAAVITNAALNDLSVYGRVSKPLYNDGKTVVTGYTEGAYNVPSETLGAGAGVRVDQSLGKGNGVYVQAAANVADVSDPDISANLRLGYMWGGAEPKSEIEQRLAQYQAQPVASQHQHADTVITYATNSQLAAGNANAAAEKVSAGAGNRESQPLEDTRIAEMSKMYFSLAEDKNAQTAFLNDAAKTFSKNSGFDMNAAKEVVLNLFEYEQEKRLESQHSL
ncbi:MAG: hypothetical protein CVU29_03765 [Betaproteobacteria bacterium HGW-Betaproteobacteria-22]|nr:MAG: hypothetical protein CVU29_03765 [Betaproteobacteria bacterium HGW-Betaproteobacteria-22]